MKYETGDKHTQYFLNWSDRGADVKACVEHWSQNVENVLLVLTENEEPQDEFLKAIESWRSNAEDRKKSFVISGDVNFCQSHFADIECAPTISEAQDIIFMEEVEREMDNM
jgi:exonuclease III